MASDILGDYKLEFASVLGSGSYGHVIKGHHINTCEQVAVKRIKIAKYDEDQEKYIERELSALRKTALHPNFVTMYIYQIQDDHHNIIMDFCDQGDLETFMKGHDIDLSLMISFIQGMVNGVFFMHSLDPPIIHRDLKAENIFIKTIDGRLVIKIGDLGAARYISADLTTVTVLGTPYFMPPEMWKNRDSGTAKLGKPVDVFSLGMIIHVVLENKAEEAIQFLCGEYKHTCMKNSILQ